MLFPKATEISMFFVLNVNAICRLLGSLPAHYLHPAKVGFNGRGMEVLKTEKNILEKNKHKTKSISVEKLLARHFFQVLGSIEQRGNN